MGKQTSPAAELERFLDFVDRCTQEYRYAYDTVSEEDKRLQDMLHELEFSADKTGRNRVATKLQRSRRNHRENKDMVKQNEKIVKFFEDQKNRDTLNRMRQLLGQQRKEEEYLQGERIYIPRVRR